MTLPGTWVEARVQACRGVASEGGSGRAASAEEKMELCKMLARAKSLDHCSARRLRSPCTPRREIRGKAEEGEGGVQGEGGKGWKSITDGRQRKGGGEGRVRFFHFLKMGFV